MDSASTCRLYGHQSSVGIDVQPQPATSPRGRHGARRPTSNDRKSRKPEPETESRRPVVAAFHRPSRDDAFPVVNGGGVRPQRQRKWINACEFDNSGNEPRVHIYFRRPTTSTTFSASTAAPPNCREDSSEHSSEIIGLCR